MSLDFTIENIKKAKEIEFKEYKKNDSVKLIFSDGTWTTFKPQKVWRIHPDYKMLYEEVLKKMRLE